MIAIWNATAKELLEVEDELQVQNYWRQLGVEAQVYVLTDYAWTDADELADYAHDDLLEAGWEVLQATATDTQKGEGSMNNNEQVMAAVAAALLTAADLVLWEAGNALMALLEGETVSWDSLLDELNAAFNEDVAYGKLADRELWQQLIDTEATVQEQQAILLQAAALRMAA